MTTSTFRDVAPGSLSSWLGTEAHLQNEIDGGGVTAASVPGKRRRFCEG